MRTLDILSGTKVLIETNSKYNRNIKVIRDFTWGTYIKVEGLTQSGGILSQVWRETLKKFIKIKPYVKNCLILGLGGGSVANLVYKSYPDVNLTGVDVDEKMVSLGKKYLDLGKIDIDVKIADAFEYVKKGSEKYDLVLIDLYCGSKFPEKFGDDKFVKNVKDLLNENGIAIFNRLYRGDDRADTMKFGRRLEKIFKKVDYVFPQANLMFVCYN